MKPLPAPRTVKSASRSGGALPGVDFARPLVAVDVVIFAVSRDALNVLLLARPDQAGEPFPLCWALPGGFVDVAHDRTLQDCARRKLLEKTAVAAPYLEQLGSWGSASRDPRGWSATHAYLALIDQPTGPMGSPGTDAAAPDGLIASAAATFAADRPASAGESRWFDVNEAARQTLAFDHLDIFQAALARLRSKVEYTSLPAFLLPEPFTLPELQRTYEIVLGRPMDKSAFRRRMLDAAFLETAGSVGGVSGRPAQGYRVKNRAFPVTFPRTFRSHE